MTVSEEEKKKIIADYREDERRKLSDRMRILGKIRSARKRKSCRQNIKSALAVKWKKQMGTVKPKRKK